MTVTTADYGKNLVRFGVASAETVEAFLKSPAAVAAQDAQTLAIAAVRAGLATRFQAEEILNGRGRYLRVDHYLLTDILGYGGMGTVYIGIDRHNGQERAVKLLDEKFKHEAGMRARFHLEAKAGMKLDHPRLVKTYELGKVQSLYGDTDYMAMELVRGVTLLEGISFSNGPVKWDAASDIIAQAAMGLQYLHECRMVHRDVKPDNILIDVHGGAKLLDFGLTLANDQSFDEEFSLAMIFGQDCLGTADFIPPEQSLDSMHVDGRADIYSLGCTLYVALTGHRPFPRADRASTVRAHRTDPRPRAEAYNPTLPKPLGDLIEQMMAIEADRRPQTMNEVIERLAPYRRRRNWAFEFQQVLVRRREIKRKILLQSQATQERAMRPTKLTSKVETDAPGGADRPADRPR